MKKILTIAGSDSSGGAGIQADLKTILSHGCYGMSVITALTAQNTTGVYDRLNCPSEFFENQIDCVFQDIYPDAVKIGMLSNITIVKSLIVKLEQYMPERVVFDPVMISSSGRRLLDDDAIELIKFSLFKYVDLITPNIGEAEVLSGVKIRCKEDMIYAAKEISKYYTGNILIKGGHSFDNADDLLFVDGLVTCFNGERIENNNSHGTGCTLSSSIACNLANDISLEESVRGAKLYVRRLLKDDMNLGRGSGPLNHCV